MVLGVWLLKHQFLHTHGYRSLFGLHSSLGPQQSIGWLAWAWLLRLSCRWLNSPMAASEWVLFHPPYLESKGSIAWSEYQGSLLPFYQNILQANDLSKDPLKKKSKSSKGRGTEIMTLTPVKVKAVQALVLTGSEDASARFSATTAQHASVALKKLPMHWDDYLVWLEIQSSSSDPQN